MRLLEAADILNSLKKAAAEAKAKYTTAWKLIHLGKEFKSKTCKHVVISKLNISAIQQHHIYTKFVTFVCPSVFLSLVFMDIIFSVLLYYNTYKRRLI